MKTKTNTKERNSEVVRQFLVREPGEGHNLVSNGDKLTSYSTVIAQWIEGQLIVNYTTYTPTTTKHQDILRRIQCQPMIRLVNGVPSGTPDLTDFLINNPVQPNENK